MIPYKTGKKEENSSYTGSNVSTICITTHTHLKGEVKWSTIRSVHIDTSEKITTLQTASKSDKSFPRYGFSKLEYTKTPCWTFYISENIFNKIVTSPVTSSVVRSFKTHSTRNGVLVTR